MARSTGRIAFARLELTDPGRGPKRAREALLKSLKPGTLVERYDRYWRMARYTHEGTTIAGRIGYQAPGSLEEHWDESAKDFHEERLVLGATSPFVIDTRTLRVAFQLRSNRIRPKTFTGNLQALLNEASSARWRVVPEVAETTWEDWTGRIARVQQVRITIRRPNPHYRGRKRVEKLVEGAKAAMVTMVVKAQDDAPGGVNIDDEFIAEAIDHAEDHGRVTAQGWLETVDTLLPSTWRSDVEGATIQREVPINPITKEVDKKTLKKELRAGEAHERELDDADNDDEDEDAEGDDE